MRLFKIFPLTLLYLGIHYLHELVKENVNSLCDVWFTIPTIVGYGIPMEYIHVFVIATAAVLLVEGFKSSKFQPGINNLDAYLSITVFIGYLLCIILWPYCQTGFFAALLFFTFIDAVVGLRVVLSMYLRDFGSNHPDHH